MSIRVLIVDDSALVRKILSDIINNTNDLELIATAHDPLFAIEKLKTKKVDVILLDIEMPRMDGLTFLERLMNAMATPVIIISSLNHNNAKLTLKAFELGAFDVFTKPENLLELTNMENGIIESIRNAAQTNVKGKLIARFNKSTNTENINDLSKSITINREITNKLIVIGSSTGGTTAIVDILSELPVDIPGIVIVQHMPLSFSHAFAERLNNILKLNVKIAESDEIIQNGFVYITPGEQHSTIYTSGAKYYLHLNDNPRVNYHRPSVTVLFESVAKCAGSNAVGIMLTGMGEDGSKAMKKMKDAGSYNIVQDEGSSVVWGMPGKAVEYGAASIVSPLEKIAIELCNYFNRNN